jgi:VanZ family protein
MPAIYFSHSPIYFKGIDKIVHGTIYLFLALLLFLLFIDLRLKLTVKNYFIIFVLASTYGLLMELLQLWIMSVSRSFETGDIFANCLGIITGIVIGIVVSPFLLKKLKVHRP